MPSAARSPTKGAAHGEDRRAAVFPAVALAALPLAAFAGVLLGLGARPLPWSFALPWVPELDVALAFRVDGLAALMLLLITGVGAAVFVYAAGYLAGDPRRGRVLGLLAAFLVAMVGCVTADDLVVLFLFWEATSVLSFLLVGTDHEDARARASARQALLVTGGGGLCLLAGFLLLAGVAGTYSLSEIVARGAELTSDPAFPWAFALIVLGCATKSAQFPFHFWLPDAMAAPTPVSAYLHSATMVKLGVYLLARLDGAFGGWAPWALVLVPLGAVSSTWAMLLVLFERDLKRILAWSTIGALGTLVMLIGLGPGAELATAAFLAAHALYKAPLFFVAGNVDHGTGTRVIDRLGGLRRSMPFTAAAAALAGISMAGLPLSFGFLAKDAIKAAKASAETAEILIAVAQSNRLVAALAVAVAAVAAVRVFWRHPGVNETCSAHEGSPAMVLPPLVLATTGIALGLFPGTVEPLLRAAARSMSPTGTVESGLSSDFVPLLGALATTLGLGLLVFLAWDPLHAALARVPLLGRHGIATLWNAGWGGLAWMAARVTRVVQHGRLPGYAALALGAVSGVLGALLVAGAPFALPRAGAPGPTALAGALVVAVGAVAACCARDRLLLVLAAGLVGYGSAILFLAAGAPDVAFTQFVVETVLVVVIAAVLALLRRARRGTSLAEPRFRPGAALLGLAFGVALALLLLAVAAQPLAGELDAFFAERALPEARGRNVVNVVLVDFRALDTLGEVAVVAFSFLAALPLFTALRARRRDAA